MNEQASERTNERTIVCTVLLMFLVWTFFFIFNEKRKFSKAQYAMKDFPSQAELTVIFHVWQPSFRYFPHLALESFSEKLDKIDFDTNAIVTAKSNG